MSADPTQLDLPDAAAELARRYDTIAYAAQAHAQTHPAHLAMVATLLGRSPPPVATCRVLEIGCADGANLLPMAATLPRAQFTGCDLSGHAIAAATRLANDLGLTNVALLQQDLRTLLGAPGSFDYIIAHGVYSWVPEPVREALLTLAAERLSPQGLMYVSFNTFPGCHVRQATWEVLHAHVDALPTAAERLDAARSLAALLAEPGVAQNETDGLLRAEFGKLATKSDSALYHDDLAVPNQPFHFREFTAALAPHGLAFVAETKLSMMTPAGLSPRIVHWVAGMDLLAREQYLDYARMRRFRQSVVGRADAPVNMDDIATRVANMHAAASMPLVRTAAEGTAFGGDPAAASPDLRAVRALLQWLVEQTPRAIPMADAAAWHARNFPGASRSAATILVEACYAGVVDLHVHPPPLAAQASARPEASALVRWQIARQPGVTNLRHETLRIDDPLARGLLAALDGSRTHDELGALLAAALPAAERATAPARVATYLSHFALHALLRA
ncbi:MAG: class I SAM-dependent methyltransferase [Casimicrobiaceae bacterium]